MVAQEIIQQNPYDELYILLLDLQRTMQHAEKDAELTKDIGTSLSQDIASEASTSVTLACSKCTEAIDAVEALLSHVRDCSQRNRLAAKIHELRSSIEPFRSTLMRTFARLVATQ
jgi:hypothetical protein